MYTHTHARDYINTLSFIHALKYNTIFIYFENVKCYCSSFEQSILEGF